MVRWLRSLRLVLTLVFVSASATTIAAQGDVGPGARGTLWESPNYGWFAYPYGSIDTIVPHVAGGDDPSSLDAYILTAYSDQGADGAVFASAADPDRAAFVVVGPDVGMGASGCVEESKGLIDDFAEGAFVDWDPDIDPGVAVVLFATYGIGMDESVLLGEPDIGLIDSDGSGDYDLLTIAACWVIDGVTGIRVEIMPYPGDDDLSEVFPMVVGPIQAGYHNTARPRSPQEVANGPDNGILELFGECYIEETASTEPPEGLAFLGCYVVAQNIDVVSATIDIGDLALGCLPYTPRFWEDLPCLDELVEPYWYEWLAGGPDDDDQRTTISPGFGAEALVWFALPEAPPDGTAILLWNQDRDVFVAYSIRPEGGAGGRPDIIAED